MAGDLDAIDKDNVVMIEAVSSVVEGRRRRPPISDRVAGSTMVRLANAVARVGGTRNGFNRIACKSSGSAAATGGLTYALVGWKGAREGAGAEAAAGVDGAGETATLSGMLRPDRQSRFRPAGADTNPEALSELVLDEPTHEVAARRRAGGRRKRGALVRSPARPGQRLGPDPRARMRYSELAGEWERIAGDRSSRRSPHRHAARHPSPTRSPSRSSSPHAASSSRSCGWVGSVRAIPRRSSRSRSRTRARC